MKAMKQGQQPNKPETATDLADVGQIDVATLGQRINDAHALAIQHAVNAIDYAREAGRLLTEAKANVKHGEWLQWMKDNVQLSERTAQGYMRLHNQLSNPENTQRVADLGIKGALQALAIPLLHDNHPADPSGIQNVDDYVAWHQEQMRRPFSEWDFDRPEGVSKHLTAKIMLHAGFPPIAELLLGIGQEYDLPMLRLCPVDAICDALKKIAPLAKEEVAVPTDVGNMPTLKAANGLRMIGITAKRIAGSLLCELKHRDELDDETYEQECADVHKEFMTATSEALGQTA